MRKLNKIYNFFFSESVFLILPATCGVNTLFFFFSRMSALKMIPQDKIISSLSQYLSHTHIDTQ